MMSSIYSAVSGLKSQQTKLDVIGNNIANVNTVGYKATTVSFADLLSQTISGATAANTTTGTGGTNAKQIGTGASVATTTTITSVGSTQSTGNDTDVSISGSGYFVVQGGGSGTYQFTRAGNFGVDSSGNLTVNGYNVCGWSDYTLDANGNYIFDTDTAVESVNLFSDGKQVLAAKQSTTSTLTGSIDATADAKGSSTTPTVENAATTGTTANATTNATGLTALTSTVNSSTTTAISISINGTTISIPASATVAQTITAINAESATTGVTASFNTDDTSNGFIQLTSTDVGTSAEIELTADGAVLTDVFAATTDATATSITANGIAADSSTTLTVYDALGNDYNVQVNLYKSYIDTTDPDNPITYYYWETETSEANGTVSGSGLIAFDDDGKVITSNGTYDTTPSITVTPTNGNAGAAAFDVTLDMTALTASSTDSLTNTSDGYEAGTLEGFSIGSDGIITGTYSNGYTQPLGVIALATFTNAAGLLKLGSGLYVTTVNSGDFTGGVTAGSSGTGSLSAGTLEMSNVDLSEQFSEMMITQRAYQANSKVLSAADECLQAVINMV